MNIYQTTRVHLYSFESTGLLFGRFPGVLFQMRPENNLITEHPSRVLRRQAGPARGGRGVLVLLFFLLLTDRPRARGRPPRMFNGCRVRKKAQKNGA